MQMRFEGRGEEYPPIFKAIFATHFCFIDSLKDYSVIHLFLCLEKQGYACLVGDKLKCLF